jgi:hypothetical protein
VAPVEGENGPGLELFRQQDQRCVGDADPLVAVALDDRSDPVEPVGRNATSGGVADPGVKRGA